MEHLSQVSKSKISDWKVSIEAHVNLVSIEKI